MAWASATETVWARAQVTEKVTGMGTSFRRCFRTRQASATPRSRSRLPRGLVCASEEFPRDVEAHIPVVVRRPAARDLTHRRAEAVREVQLERVSSSALLDGKRSVIHAWLVAGARDHRTLGIEQRAGGTLL